MKINKSLVVFGFVTVWGFGDLRAGLSGCMCFYGEISMGGYQGLIAEYNSGTCTVPSTSTS